MKKLFRLLLLLLVPVLMLPSRSPAQTLRVQSGTNTATIAILQLDPANILSWSNAPLLDAHGNLLRADGRLVLTLAGTGGGAGAIATNALNLANTKQTTNAVLDRLLLSDGGALTNLTSDPTKVSTNASFARLGLQDGGGLTNLTISGATSLSNALVLDISGAISALHLGTAATNNYADFLPSNALTGYMTGGQSSNVFDLAGSAKTAGDGAGAIATNALMAANSAQQSVSSLVASGTVYNAQFWSGSALLADSAHIASNTFALAWNANIGSAISALNIGQYATTGSVAVLQGEINALTNVYDAYGAAGAVSNAITALGYQTASLTNGILGSLSIADNSISATSGTVKLSYQLGNVVLSYSSATGTCAVAMGQSCKALGTDVTAIGIQANATNDHSIVISTIAAGSGGYGNIVISAQSNVTITADNGIGTINLIGAQVNISGTNLLTLIGSVGSNLFLTSYTVDWSANPSNSVLQGQITASFNLGSNALTVANSALAMTNGAATYTSGNGMTVSNGLIFAAATGTNMVVGGSYPSSSVGTATFASNAGSLNGVPGGAYLQTNGNGSALTGITASQVGALASNGLTASAISAAGGLTNGQGGVAGQITNGQNNVSLNNGTVATVTQTNQVSLKYDGQLPNTTNDLNGISLDLNPTQATANQYIRNGISLYNASTNAMTNYVMFSFTYPKAKATNINLGFYRSAYTGMFSNNFIAFNWTNRLSGASAYSGIYTVSVNAASTWTNTTLTVPAFTNLPVGATVQGWWYATPTTTNGASAVEYFTLEYEAQIW